MMKKIFYTFIGIGLAIAGSVSAVMISVPSATQYGQTLIGNTNGTYTPTATSSLGLPTFASLSSYLSLSSWYATTTDGLDEGLTNLYFTNPRVLTYLDTLSKGYFFSTTSADAWDLTKSRWATTSSDYWYTIQNKASSTLLSDTNTWSGTNVFPTLATNSTTGTSTFWGSLSIGTSSSNYTLETGGDVLFNEMAPYQVVTSPMSNENEQIITAFQPGHGFTYSTGGGSSADDLTDFVIGSSSLKVITDSSATQSRVQNLSIPSFSVVNKTILATVKVDKSFTTTDQLFIGFSSDNFTNYFYCSFTYDAFQEYYGGSWFPISCSASDYNTTGSPNLSAITAIRLYVRGQTGTTHTAWFNKISLVPNNVSKKGVVSITFDDGNASQYSLGRAVLATSSYNFPATAYIETDTVGTGVYMTKAQLHVLQDINGWDISAHHQSSFASLSAAQQEKAIVSTKNWLLKNGFSKGSDHFAYPQGEMVSTTTLPLMKKYFTSARMSSDGRHETLPVGNRYKLKVFPVKNTTATSTVYAAIDKAAANHDWLILVFHIIKTSGASVQTEYNQRDLQYIADYLYASRNTVEVKTVSEVFNRNDDSLLRLVNNNLGIGTTSPFAKLSVVGETVSAYFTATTTSNNTFPNLTFTNATGTSATTTNFAATTICLVGDTCRTTWPSAGGGVWPFTPVTNFGLSMQSTSTPLWFTGTSGIYASGTSVLGTTSVRTLNGVFYADQFPGADAGAKINNAYANCPSSGCTIIAPTGSNTFSTKIAFETNAKPVRLECPAGSKLIWNGTGTSTVFNTGMDFNSRRGMFGCYLYGPDVGVGGTTVGVQIGGTNGEPGVTIEGNYIIGFGKGIVTTKNVWDINVKNNRIQFNDRNIEVYSGDNSGENFVFTGNNISDCSTVTKCVYFKTNGSVTSSWFGNVFDNAQLYFEDGNANINITGGGFENPNEGAIGRYTYIVIADGGYSNMTITGTQFSNGASTLANSPYQFISNGGNLKLDNVTVQSFSSVESPVFVGNYGGGFYSGQVFEIGTALTDISTTTSVGLVQLQNGRVGYATTTPLDEFGIKGNVGIYSANGLNIYNDDNTAYTTISRDDSKVHATWPWGFDDGVTYGSGFNSILPPTGGALFEGQVGVGTSSPASLFSIQGIANQVLALFDVATSEFNSLFRINANGSVQNGFTSGTTTKQNMLSDPDNIASITAANYMATYSDDPSRLIMCGTAAGSNIHIRNKGFANASQQYIGTTAQTVTWTTLYNSAVVGRGCITAGGYHYVLYASTTNAAATAIRRSTAADWSTISTTANWATSTISGVALPTTAFLVGAEGGNIYIATTTNAVQKYTIATSTNTLTSSTYIPLTGANVLINNTRVNSNGIYVGFSAAPFTRKYTLSGTAVSGITNIGVAVPSATGPDMFATDMSLYGLYGNSTTLLSKVYGY